LNIGNKIKPYPVPQKTPVKIALIYAEFYPFLFKISLDFLALDLNERPDNRTFHQGKDASQPSKPTSSHEPHQKSLCLIGHGMTSGDFSSSDLKSSFF